MTPTATYIAEENCLQEISQMADPGTCPNELDGIEKCDACKNLAVSYAAHLATLRKIPCRWPAEKQWKDGQLLIEGVDYELRKDDWMPETEDEYNEALHDAKNELPGKIPQVLYAFPLVPVKSEDEVELWKDMLIEYEGLQRMEENTFEWNIGILREKYTLTPKQ